jgi:hypothetical protein
LSNRHRASGESAPGYLHAMATTPTARADDDDDDDDDMTVPS